mgnify:FL=1
MTIEDWWDVYKPIEIKCWDNVWGLDAENIWTVVAGDDDLWLIPGKHLVNRMACYFSHTPWGDADIELEFWYVS